jgi:hypothetical protein
VEIDSGGAGLTLMVAFLVTVAFRASTTLKVTLKFPAVPGLPVRVPVASSVRLAVEAGVMLHL